MPFDERHIAMIAYRPAAFAIASQVFVQKEAVRLAANFEPHGIIVVLLDFSNLNIAHHIAIIHHGKASGPTIVEHSCFGDVFRATDNRSCRFAVLVHFFVARVAECITVLGHESNLLFEFFRSPQVITIQEGNPLAFRFAKGAIAAVCCTMVTVVFKITDSRGREILRLRLRSAQDDRRCAFLSF